MKRDRDVGGESHLPQLPSNMQDEGAVYDAMVAPESKLLPPGWEVLVVEGEKIYVDHMSREAHKQPPWVLWRERYEAAAM